MRLARRFANCLDGHSVHADLAFIDKRRPKGTHNVAVAEEVVGEVAGRRERGWNAASPSAR